MLSWQPGQTGDVITRNLLYWTMTCACTFHTHRWLFHTRLSSKLLYIASKKQKKSKFEFYLVHASGAILGVNKWGVCTVVLVNTCWGKRGSGKSYGRGHNKENEPPLVEFTVPVPGLVVPLIGLFFDWLNSLCCSVLVWTPHGTSPNPPRRCSHLSEIDTGEDKKRNKF